MQVASISNNSFGTLTYNPKARKVIGALIRKDILSNNRSIIEHINWNYGANQVNRLELLENYIRTKRIKSEKHTNNILNKFKDALILAQQSKTQNVNISLIPKSKKQPNGIIVTINDEQFAHRQGSSILTFLNKISNKILNK